MGTPYCILLPLDMILLVVMTILLVVATKEDVLVACISVLVGIEDDGTVEKFNNINFTKVHDYTDMKIGKKVICTNSGTNWLLLKLFKTPPLPLPMLYVCLQLVIYSPACNILPPLFLCDVIDGSAR